MLRKVMIALATAALVGGVLSADAQARGARVGHTGYAQTQMGRGFASGNETGERPDVSRGFRPGFAHDDLGVQGYGCTVYPDYGLHTPHFC
jgi:opacity protein-like surface antigen